MHPLYLYPETTRQQSLHETITGDPPGRGECGIGSGILGRRPNLNPAIVQQIADKLGLAFTPEKSTVIPAGIGGEDSLSSPALPSSMKVAGSLNTPVTGYPHPGGYDASFENVQTAEIRESGNQNITPTGFAPIDLLDYIYAVLHSPSYRET